MGIRLIAADLDGTLFDEKKQISGRNLEALGRAAAMGILFVTATGRIYEAIPRELKELPGARYAIVVNGSGIYDRERGELIHREEIPAKRAAELCRFMRQYHSMYDCYQNGKGYVNQYYYDRIDTFCRPEYRPMYRATRSAVESLEEQILRQGDVQKMQMFFTDGELRQRAMRELAEAFPDMAVTSSVPNNIEVNICAANKGKALRILCARLGIDLSQTIAFGDGGNDITMLQSAGTGVAMANACQEAKEAARAVTADNESDGVAVYLEKYVL